MLFCPWLFFQTVFFAISALIVFFSLTEIDIVVFFMSLDRKFNEDSKNVLRNMIRSLKMRFTCYFVIDCSFKLCFLQFKL